MLKAVASAIIAVVIVSVLWNTEGPDAIAVQGPAILEVQEMGALAVLKVSYANVIDLNKPMAKKFPLTNWKLTFGNTRVLLIAKGSCLIGTDLKLARYENIDLENRTASLVLQQPAIISVSVHHDPNHQGSYLYSVDANGLSGIMPDSARTNAIINQAYAIAQQDIEQHCASQDYFNDAKKTTELVLAPLLAADPDWNIAIAWANAKK